jgi:glycosyltransferase involved in cell wall biosynthesis
MKIAFDHQIFLAQKYGGISRYFVNLANNLNSYNNVEVFAPFHNNFYLKNSNFRRNIYLKNNLPKTQRIINAINLMLTKNRLNRFKPDIIHHTYYYPSNSFHEFKPIIVSTIHDLIHEKFPNYFSSNKTIFNKKKSIESADHLICVSESTKNDLLDYYNIPSEKISVVHHGFELGFNETFSKEISFENKPFLLYVGTREIYKNFNFFIKTISKSNRILKDFNIVVFGGCFFTNSEKRYFKECGLESNQLIHVTGDDSTLNFLYRNARALVYPSLYEGFGLPLLEAMANNCPVISSNTSSMPEVLGNAGQYFDPKNSENILYSIESVIYSDSRINELRMLGSERIKYFSWTKCAENTNAVYEKLLSSKNG